MVKRHIVGSYQSELEAIEAIEDLKRRGYRSEEISVISKNSENVEHIQEKTGTHAADGAATGAATGGILGGVGGVLAGLGALAIPGIGPIIAAGPIIAGITGLAAGAGVGGLAGALIGLGIPEEEANRYNEHFNNGRIIVFVDGDHGNHTTDYVDRNIL